VRPHVAKDVQEAGGVVDARHPFEPRLLGRDQMVLRVRIHGDRERIGTGGGERAGQAGKLSEHGCAV
jgi:hypothetical protein